MKCDILMFRELLNLILLSHNWIKRFSVFYCDTCQMSHNKKINLMDYVLHNLCTNNFAFEIKLDRKGIECKPCSEDPIASLYILSQVQAKIIQVYSFP